MQKVGVVVIILALAVGSYAQKASKVFYANDEKNRNVVTFTSKAPLETVVGTTGHILGFVDTDPADIMNTRARFEVDLASLKTGIDVRDGHMRSQYLETQKHPNAIFELTSVLKADQISLENQKPINLEVEGTFTVHGVSKIITIPLTITYYQESDETKFRLPGDVLRVEGAWDVLLSDHDIKRPQFVILKLDDKQRIEIDVFASTGSPTVSFAPVKSIQ